jgi:hypothetical protein
MYVTLTPTAAMFLVHFPVSAGLDLKEMEK